MPPRCLPPDDGRFPGGAPPVSTDLSGLLDHPVAGDKVSHRIFSNGTAHRLQTPGIVHIFGHNLI